MSVNLSRKREHAMNTKHTLTLKKTLMTLYRCTRCKQNVLQPVELQMRRRYSDNAIFTRKDRKELARENKAKYSHQLEKDYLQLLKGGNTGVFLRADLRCSCPGCKKPQPWTRMNYELPLSLLSVAVFVVAILWILTYDMPFSVQYIPWILLGLVLCVVGLAAHYLVMTAKLRKAFRTAPPLFARTTAELQQKAAAYDAYASIDWNQLKTL